MTIPIEEHPLGFFLPENAQILMLGSFPPKKERWSMNFYYPNIQNDMWRIMGLIFYGNKEHFITFSQPSSKKQTPEFPTHKTKSQKICFNEEQIRTFCSEKGLALGDTAVKVKRLKDNASDKFLEVVEPLDIENILNMIPHCHTIIITGEKAMETLLQALNTSTLINAATPSTDSSQKTTTTTNSTQEIIPTAENVQEITAPKVGEHITITYIPGANSATIHAGTTNDATNGATNSATIQTGTINDATNSTTIHAGTTNDVNTFREIKIYRMPSSSRAYPKSVEDKAAYYRKALQALL